MSNNLLTGLVEYWEPNVALGSLKGMVAGIDFGTDPDITIVAEAGFPSGKALSVINVSVFTITTAINALLEGWGATDFLWSSWCKGTTTNGYYGFGVGESMADGGDFFTSGATFPKDISGEIPGSDLSFPTVNTSGSPITQGTPHCTLFWWTSIDQTLHLQVDNGTEFTTVSPVPAGTPDPNNSAFYQIGNSLVTAMLGGDVGIWRGTIPDATQRALLFGGLPFSQWDSGGAAIPQRAASGQYAIRTH